jgi:hypothetical protein
MRTSEDIETFLIKAGLAYQVLKPGVWAVQTEGSDGLVISVAGPILAFRLRLMDLPVEGREELYRKLLSWNTTDMVHGAFGLEGDAVVLIHALELENLDFNEVQAVVDDMSMAVARFYPQLASSMPHHVGAGSAARPRA